MFRGSCRIAVPVYKALSSTGGGRFPEMHFLSSCDKEDQNTMAALRSMDLLTHHQHHFKDVLDCLSAAFSQNPTEILEENFQIRKPSKVANSRECTYFGDFCLYSRDYTVIVRVSHIRCARCTIRAFEDF